jgi:hypothetical protein
MSRTGDIIIIIIIIIIIKTPIIIVKYTPYEPTQISHVLYF